MFCYGYKKVPWDDSHEMWKYILWLCGLMVCYGAFLSELKWTTLWTNLANLEISMEYFI